MPRFPVVALMVTLLASGACAPRDDDAGERARGTDAGIDTETGTTLGPADGHELPGADLDRVQVGRPAPDFTLASLAGPPVTLSDFRGAKNVVLVFYRGHW